MTGDEGDHDDNHTLVCTLHEFNVTYNQAIASIIGFSFVGLIGVVGNMLVIFVFSGTRDKTLKLLVFALAIADLTSCGLVLPLDLFRIYRKNVVMSRFYMDHTFADLVVCIRHAVFGVEGSVLFLVALDRFWCICRPSKGRMVTGMFIGTVLSTTGLIILVAEGAITSIHLWVDTRCKMVIPMRRTLMRVYISLAFVGMAVLAGLYGSIFSVVLRQDARNSARRRVSYDYSVGSTLPPSSPTLKDPDDGSSLNGGGDSVFSNSFNRANSVGSAMKKRSRRTAMMLFCSTLVFYGTLSPIILAYLGVLPEGPHYKLYYVNNAMNVILYSALNPNFRRETRKRFSKVCSNCYIVNTSADKV